MENEKIIEELKPKEPLDPYWGVQEEAKRFWQKAEIKIPKDIPTGEKCGNCKYKATKIKKLINMFGDDSGYEENQYCSLFDCELNNYHLRDCNDRKCSMCYLKTFFLA